MIYKTWDQIRAKVQRELDLEAEEFVQPDEFIEYVNDGVSMCEAEIHDLGLEDQYYLTKFPVPLVTLQADYTLPSPIYINKIIAFVYSKGATIYTIERMRGISLYENIAHIEQYNTITDFYKFVIRNDSADAGVKLQLVPPSRETDSTAATMWYIRECTKWDPVADAAGVGKCDLPQIAMQFLYQYVKYRCYEKEGHPNTLDAKADLATVKATMISMMENMVPDNNTELIKDLSAYQDMS